MADLKESAHLLKRILSIDQKWCITTCKALKQVLFTPTDGSCALHNTISSCPLTIFTHIILITIYYIPFISSLGVNNNILPPG
jgi:hypothetical protein